MQEFISETNELLFADIQSLMTPNETEKRVV